MTVAYIFERYPVLTQTFLRREIAALRALGLRVEIHAMLPGGARSEEPVERMRLRELLRLPWELARAPGLVREGWRLLRRCRFRSAENFFSTVWAVVYALCRAERFRRRKPDVIHGVWATGPATAAAVLGRLCGVPFSFGAHAHDMYRHGGDAFLGLKLRAAAFVHTTTEAAAAELRRRWAGARIVLARRGLSALPPLRHRNDEPGPLRILSVGRLVPKKGHRIQLEACAALKRAGVEFEARIVGDGPLRRQLERIAPAAVTFRGAVKPEQMAAEYAWADVLWHTGVVDEDGDRDGLPNVIGEAWAHGVAVVSSDAGGAAEAGPAWIVPAGDAGALARAVERLARDPVLRRRLGEAGRRWVEENFLASRNAEILARAFYEAGRR
jgi:colanic acid/amylovoran biosynthesis glycosyltransferase